MGKPLCNRQGREQGRSNAKVPGLPEKEAGPPEGNPREIVRQSSRLLVLADQCHGDILAYLANNPDRIEEFRQGKNPMKGKVQSTLGSFE